MNINFSYFKQDSEDLIDWQDRLFGFLKMQLVVRLPILSFTSQFAPHTSHFLYSVLKLFTGFANAAFIDRILMVIKAIIITIPPAAVYIHQLIFIR